MAGINHTLEYYCKRYIEKPTCARYDALAEKVVNLSEGKITRVTRCSECVHFHDFGNGYGECNKFGIRGTIMRPCDFCSYAEKKAPLTEYDDHTTSGLLEE